MSCKKPTALVILDGFGYSPNTQNNAIAQGKMPHFNSWMERYPHTLLKASGQAVGLLDNVIGNSEVGHMTIGAGRIIQQPLTIIHNAITDGSFFENPLLLEKLAMLKKTGNTLHIMGLLSDAGVHSHTELLYALIKAAVTAGITHIIIHPFLDGRDVAPRSAQHYMQQLDNYLKTTDCGIIGSIHGRFYAMDRDHNWDRTNLSYQALTQLQPSTYTTWQELIKANYAQGITDEFIVPTQLSPKAVIKQGDGIIFFNIRPDRARQLTQAFIDPIFKQFPTQHLNLSCFITPVTYGDALKTDVLFTPPLIKNTLKEVLSDHDKSMLSIAETEKYAHVTYFFAGGKEKIFNTEVRILIPSVATKSFADFPAMSAPLITQAVIKSLEKAPKCFYLINYANADMVGHSGDLNATIKAVECLDKELEELYQVIVEQMDGTLYITADHGKAEQMFDPKTNQPCTSHTTNPVPFIMLRKDLENKEMALPLTQLADIAPWILEHMELPVPDEMKRAK
ncbi:MAG: 2,3-bisphosphoglycerate-independent phosphoglycerate mutase [Candidatus Babeliales bacterium]|nr:2,3-bisphosphoglycerate-independent phosphoglycerate mutase [Candidatus Babeliales bacterium]